MSEQVWYYSQHGERKGPVTLEVLQNALAHGKIDIATDLVWGPGLTDWVKVHEVPELQSTVDAPISPPTIANTQEAPAADSSMSNIVPPSEVKKARAAENPYASPEADNDLQAAMNARNLTNLPGIGRLAFVLWNVVLTVGFFAAMLFLFFGVASYSADSGVSGIGEVLVGGIFIAFIAIYLGTFIVSIMIACSRLKNLSMSRWNYLWMLVPFASIWLTYRLIACPAGYHQHKQLDTAGKVMKTLFIIFIVLYVLLFFVVPIIFSGASAYKEAADKAAREADGQSTPIEYTE